MRFIEYLKWIVWSRHDDKPFAIFILFSVVALIPFFIATPLGMLFLETSTTMALLGTAAGIWLTGVALSGIYALAIVARHSWINFNTMKDEEAARIVKKLRGH